MSMSASTKKRLQRWDGDRGPWSFLWAAVTPRQVDLLRPAEPIEENSRRKWEMEESVEDAPENNPGSCSKPDGDRPALAGSHQIKKNHQRNGYVEAYKPED